MPDQVVHEMFQIFSDILFFINKKLVDTSSGIKLFKLKKKPPVKLGAFFFCAQDWIRTSTPRGAAT